MSWLDVFNNVILQVVQVAAIFAIGYLVTLLKKRTDQKEVQEALDMVEAAAKRAVAITAQKFVDDVREAGKLDKATADQAFDRAYAEAMMTLNKDAIAIAQKVTGDFHRFLTQKIEEQVRLQKDEKIIREV